MKKDITTSIWSHGMFGTTYKVLMIKRITLFVDSS
jgi:hypothetical protein